MPGCRTDAARAAGDDEPGSDVDVVVDFTDHASLLDEVGLRQAKRDRLQVEVDVVASDGLRGAFGDRVFSGAFRCEFRQDGPALGRYVADTVTPEPEA